MPPSAVPSEPTHDDEFELALNVSRAYWLEERSKVEIATDFGLSRFKVARILQDARRSGMVHIEITEPQERITRLAEEVRRVFGLVDVVLSTRPVSVAGGLAELGAAAASYLTEHVRPGSTIGLGWGSTIGEVVAHLAPGGPADVVQLAGGFAGSASDFNGTSVVTSASAAFGGTPYLLHAPALVATVRARASLREEAAVARTVEKYASLDLMMTGIGVLRSTPQSALYRGDVLGASVQAELRRWDVVGDACCHFIDGGGRPITALAERATGISVAEIRAVPLRVSVAGGLDKREPIRAALRSGLPNVLVTDVETARALLTMQAEESRG